MHWLKGRPKLWRLLALTSVLGVVGLGVAMSASGASSPTKISFSMVRSAASVAAGCLPRAHGDVSIVNKGPVEIMHVDLSGLPRDTDFDFFVIQVPNAPFGLSWYQGDIESNHAGRASGTFIGRFNIETFIVAPGSASAPKVHDTDATTNPATAPVHTFHLGLWFNSPADAAKARCNGATTPFNGDHNAGAQALSTRNFADDQGPLRKLVP